MQEGTDPKFAVFSVALAAASMTMAIQVVLPVLPSVQEGLGFGEREAALVTISFVGPTVILALPFARLAAAVGTHTVLIGALVLYGICGICSLWITGIEQFLALRVVQGACFAAAMPLTLVVVIEISRREWQAQAISARQTALTVGELCLPVIGAALLVGGWRAPLVAQAAAIPFALLIWRQIGLGGRPLVTSSGAGITRSVLALPGSFRALSIGFQRFFFKFTFIGYLAILFVDDKVLTVGQASLTVTAAAVATLLAVRLMPHLIGRLRPSHLAAGSMLAISLAFVGTSLVSEWWGLLLCGVIFGLGDGVLVFLQDLYAAWLWPRDQRAGAASVSQLARNLGKLASPLLAGALLGFATLGEVFLVTAGLSLIFAPIYLTLAKFDPALGCEA